MKILNFYVKADQVGVTVDDAYTDWKDIAILYCNEEEIWRSEPTWYPYSEKEEYAVDTVLDMLREKFKNESE